MVIVERNVYVEHGKEDRATETVLSEKRLRPGETKKVLVNGIRPDYTGSMLLGTLKVKDESTVTIDFPATHDLIGGVSTYKEEAINIIPEPFDRVVRAHIEIRGGAKALDVLIALIKGKSSDHRKGEIQRRILWKEDK